MEEKEGIPHASLVVARLAEAQHGVVSRAQLLARGLTRGAIDASLARGRLHRLHQGVYAVGHTVLRAEGHWLAAVLACGPAAVLSHAAAAALWELRPSAATRIDVSAPHGRKPREGIRLHRVGALHPDDVTVRDAIPTTTVARTLVDLAGTLSRERLARALDQADALHLLDARALTEALARRPGVKTGRLKALLAEQREPAMTRSELELAFLALVRAAGLPAPAVNTRIGGHEVDFARRPQRLIVEVDGARHHRTARAFEEDRARDADLIADDWRPVRFTYRQITERGPATTACLRKLYERR